MEEKDGDGKTPLDLADDELAEVIQFELEKGNNWNWNSKNKGEFCVCCRVYLLRIRPFRFVNKHFRNWTHVSIKPLLKKISSNKENLSV